MGYIIKVNEMYLSVIEVDNYDDELMMSFTSHIDSAKIISNENFLKVIKNNLSLLGLNNDNIKIIKKGEDDD